jgi:hypothetical protein
MIPLRLTFDPADISASRDLPPADVDAATAQEIATVRIEPSPLLTAIVDQARQQSETTVPLYGAGNGRRTAMPRPIGWAASGRCDLRDDEERRADRREASCQGAQING